MREPSEKLIIPDLTLIPLLVLDKGRVAWRGRYGDLAALPGDVRAALREWEGEGEVQSAKSKVQSPELPATPST